MKHWSKNFGKISANEFFNTVDYNHDGQIQYYEFLDFWKIVKGSGHSEEEIQEEVSYTKYSLSVPIHLSNKHFEYLNQIITSHVFTYHNRIFEEKPFSKLSVITLIFKFYTLCFLYLI